MEETTCTSGSLWVERRHNESRGRIGLTGNDTTRAIRNPDKQNERVFMVNSGWDTEVKNPMLELSVLISRCCKFEDVGSEMQKTRREWFPLLTILTANGDSLRTGTCTIVL